MSVQQDIYQAVADRGYVAPYSPEVFIARQIVKLAEEVGELFENLDVDLGATWEAQALNAAMEAVHLLARRVFSDPAAWERTLIGLSDVRPVGLKYVRKEAADVQVVLACLAEAISRLDVQPFDVEQAALEKATMDVARGVRGAGQ